MKHLIMLGLCAITWRGFYIGAEQTNYWRNVFNKPVISTTAVGMMGIGRVTVRVGYIQPIIKNAGPVIQIGGSVRLF